MLYLPILVPNYVEKFGTMDVGRERHPWKDHTYQGDVDVLPFGVAHVGLWWGCGKVGYHCRQLYVLQHLIPNVWQLVLAKLPVKGGLLTFMNMAFFMALVMPWDSLSTMEKLSS